jgi:hypothetical protein
MNPIQRKRTVPVSKAAAQLPRPIASEPPEDARTWIEKSGFATAQALADLIDAAVPPSKTKGR